MSVPLFPRQPGSPPPIEGGMRKTYGDERTYDPKDPDSNPNFFYQLHHQLDSAEADYAKDSRRALMAMGFGDPRKDGAQPPLVSSGKLFVEEDGVTRSPAAWERAPQPAALHDWITEPEFEYYVQDFENHGWNGGLCWYRGECSVSLSSSAGSLKEVACTVMDINQSATPQFVGAKAKQPCQFITGTLDVVVAMLGRNDKGEMSLERGMERLPTVLAAGTEQPCEQTIIEGCGHWIQQEAKDQVNERLLKFLNGFSDGDRKSAEPVWEERRARL